MLIMDSGLINKNISNNYQRSEVPGTPYKKRGTEWNFVPLALRRLFCMVYPELLLYWLFYNNKRSQNVADESL